MGLGDCKFCVDVKNDFRKIRTLILRGVMTENVRRTFVHKLSADINLAKGTMISETVRDMTKCYYTDPPQSGVG